MHALARFCHRAGAVFRTSSRVWVLHHIPLFPCLASTACCYPLFVNDHHNQNGRIGNIRERSPIGTAALGISVNDHQSERPHWEYTCCLLDLLVRLRERLEVQLLLKLAVIDRKVAVFVQAAAIHHPTVPPSRSVSQTVSQ
eukprot:1194356-Prorocentrum_minimum.AAC.1